MISSWLLVGGIALGVVLVYLSCTRLAWERTVPLSEQKRRAWSRQAERRHSA